MADKPLTPEKKEKDPHLSRAAQLEAKQLYKMCPAEQEPVLTILRAHLLAEHYLERAIAASMPRGDRVIEAGLSSFAQKLNVVEGLDVLPDQLVQSLKGLNRIRNSCAHEMEREITIPDVERIGRPFGAEFTALRQKLYPDVRELLHEVTKCVARDLSGRVYFRERDVSERFQKKCSRENA